MSYHIKINVFYSVSRLKSGLIHGKFTGSKKARLLYIISLRSNLNSVIRLFGQWKLKSPHAYSAPYATELQNAF